MLPLEPASVGLLAANEHADGIVDKAGRREQVDQRHQAHLANYLRQDVLAYGHVLQLEAGGRAAQQALGQPRQMAYLRMWHVLKCRMKTTTTIRFRRRHVFVDNACGACEQVELVESAEASEHVAHDQRELLLNAGEKLSIVAHVRNVPAFEVAGREAVEKRASLILQLVDCFVGCNNNNTSRLDSSLDRGCLSPQRVDEYVLGERSFAHECGADQTVDELVAEEEERKLTLQCQRVAACRLMLVWRSGQGHLDEVARRVEDEHGREEERDDESVQLVCAEYAHEAGEGRQVEKQPFGNTNAAAL